MHLEFCLNKGSQKESLQVFWGFFSAHWVWKRFRENLASLAIVNFQHVWQTRVPHLHFEVALK